MTDTQQDELQDPLEAGKTDKPAEVAPVAPVKAARRSGSALGGILLTLLLVAVAGLGYLGWQQRETVAGLQQRLDTLAQGNQQNASLADAQQQLRQDLQQNIQAVQNALDQLQSQQQQVRTAQQQQQTAVQQQLQALNATVNGQMAQMANIERNVDALGMRLAETGDSAVRDQVLAEVEGILRLADLRLQATQDVDTALALLRTADDLLSRVVAPDIAALRTQLQGDAAALRAVIPADVLGVHQQLGALITQLDTLRAVSATAPSELSVPATATAEAPAGSGWLHDTMNFLGQYFVITQRDAPITPLLSPEQDWLVRKNIALKLEQARLAALARDTDLFHNMLDEAQTDIDQGLAGEGKTELLATLASMDDVELQLTLPSLANSLRAVEQLQTRLPGAPAAEAVQ